MTTLYTLTWVTADGRPEALATDDLAAVTEQRQRLAGQGFETFWSEFEYGGVVAPPEKPVILLDLNYTLVGNSWDTFDVKRGPDIGREIYRTWLVALLQGHHVIMITARTADFQAETLASIAEKTGGWQPEEWYFKPYPERYRPAPDFKESVLLDYVFPRHGQVMSNHVGLLFWLI